MKFFLLCDMCDESHDVTDEWPKLRDRYKVDRYFVCPKCLKEQAEAAKYFGKAIPAEGATHDR